MLWFFFFCILARHYTPLCFYKEINLRSVTFLSCIAQVLAQCTYEHTTNKQKKSLTNNDIFLHHICGFICVQIHFLRLLLIKHFVSHKIIFFIFFLYLISFFHALRCLTETFCGIEMPHIKTKHLEAQSAHFT